MLPCYLLSCLLSSYTSGHCLFLLFHLSLNIWHISFAVDSWSCQWTLLLYVYRWCVWLRSLALEGTILSNASYVILTHTSSPWP